MVETLLQSGSRKGKLLDSVITNQNIELMDMTVKIEEIPLKVPCVNHSRSATDIKTELTSNNVVLKKSSSEKVASNKKSPRKQIPTRGESNMQILPIFSVLSDDTSKANLMIYQHTLNSSWLYMYLMLIFKGTF